MKVGHYAALRRLGPIIAVFGSSALIAAACNTDPPEVQVADDPYESAPMPGLIRDDPAARVNATCVEQTTAAEPRQIAMYMMLDTSGSMLEATGTVRNKWDSVVRAVRGFLNETLDSDLQVGLQFFPLVKPGSRFNCSVESDCGPDSDGDGVSDGGPCFLKTCRSGSGLSLCVSQSDCPGGAVSNPCVPFGICSGSKLRAPVLCELRPDVAVACDDGLGSCADFDRSCTNAASCDAALYATPAVEIGLVSQNLTAVDRALTAREPRGLTPTVPALQGAIEHARAWSRAHPDQTTVVLLATDGLPTECGQDATNQGQGTPQPIEDVLSIAESGLEGDIPVRTFVIGVFEPGDTDSRDNVSALARAGGTDRAVFIDSSADVDQQFLDALRAIRSGQLGCEFELPPSGAPLDYFQVNLKFTNGTNSQQLPFVGDRAACDATPAGWYYDVDPTKGTPSTIIVCPNVCAQIQGATAARVQMQIGCATLIR